MRTRNENCECEKMNNEYIGVVQNYRSGSKFQRNQECLIKALDVDSNEAGTFRPHADGLQVYTRRECG